jgi:hypothetical protein
LGVGSTAVADREVYIREAPAADVLRWLEAVIGGTTLIDQLEGGVWIYRPDVLHSIASVVIRECAGGEYTAVCLIGEELPWPSDVEMARTAHRATGYEVRRDPGTLGANSLDPFEWWQVSNTGEGLIPWPDGGPE